MKYNMDADIENPSDLDKRVNRGRGNNRNFDKERTQDRIGHRGRELDRERYNDDDSYTDRSKDRKKDTNSDIDRDMVDGRHSKYRSGDKERLPDRRQSFDLYNHLEKGIDSNKDRHAQKYRKEVLNNDSEADGKRNIIRGPTSKYHKPPSYQNYDKGVFVEDDPKIYEKYDDPWDSPHTPRLGPFPFDNLGFEDVAIVDPREVYHTPYDRNPDRTDNNQLSPSTRYDRDHTSPRRFHNPFAFRHQSDSSLPPSTSAPSPIHKPDIGNWVNDGYEIPLDFPKTKEENRLKSFWKRLKSRLPILGSGKDDDEDEKNEKKKIISGEDENEERGNWSGRFDFILSMLGYAVGLGNVWRFPYLCYRNGGGAFLFPFLIMMVVIGLPLFYLEASLGQFSSCGAMTCWQFAPLFKGVGVAMVMVSAMTGLYYNMILAWSLHYMFSSFTSDLPFASCDNDWNTKDCKLKWPVVTCDASSQRRAANGECVDRTTDDKLGLWNRTLFTEVTGRVLTSPSEEYWERRVLRFSSGIENFGQPKWDLVLCLLLAWVICFLCLLKGIKTTGKVVYFTAIFPYIVLIILFFRGVTLENAGEGIRYFITPTFSKLTDANVWKDAANQIFFSMSIAGGGLITLSSYNRFHNNIFRDSMIVAIGDSFTCVLGGFVIFSYLGYMAGQLDVGIEDVARDGAGLAFVVYPEAVSNLPPPTLWALLFFFMLLTLGLDTQFAMIETVLSGILDNYPKYRPQKTLVLLAICCVLFLLGLPLTCPGGMYLLQLMDNYVGGMTLIILGFVELVAVAFIYGVNRFCEDIHLMTGSTQFLFWKITWCALSPFTILFIFVFMFVDYKRSTYDDYTYPVWADVLGWFFTVISVLAILIVMLYLISKETEGDGLWEKIKLLCMPTVYWGPALPKHRKLVTYVEGFQVDPSVGLKPRTSFTNNGLLPDKNPSIVTGKTMSLKSNGESQSQVGLSTRASHISMISGLSRGTLTSDRSGATFETSI